jgi:type VI protein secretion system component VasK
MLFALLVLLLAAICFCLWIWMLIECLTHEKDTEKIAWLLALIFLPLIGTLLYFFIRHPLNKLPPHLREHTQRRALQPRQ